MTFRSLCCSTLFGLLLGGPALCQTSSTPADQSAHAASLNSPPSAPVPKTDAQPEKSKPPTAPGETARTAEENRERLLLDRIDQLEKRLSELEARGPAAAASAARARGPQRGALRSRARRGARIRPKPTASRRG